MGGRGFSKSGGRRLAVFVKLIIPKLLTACGGEDLKLQQSDEYDFFR